VTIAAGLCSVTLRAHPVEAVTDLAAACGLAAIEWGGDVHVPPGDDAAARRAVAAGAAAGVHAASYGSYLLAGGIPGVDEVHAVLDTAVVLGAPNVRVWTPFGATATDRPAVVAALAQVAAAADARGLAVGIEHHGGTLADSVPAMASLLDEVAAPNLFGYWQPPYWESRTDAADDTAAVTALGARLSHLHVYEWPDAQTRLPLADGAERWDAVLATVADLPAPVTPRVAFLEFVAGDDPDALRRDAATLHRLLQPVAAS
jgi:sugar phosphate isomerase/epimerase